jgi:hypothetical protein
MNPSLKNTLTSADPESLNLPPKAVAAAVKLPLPSTTMIQNPRKTLTRSSLVKVNQA